VMSDAGPALMAIGHGSGENRAVEAARQAIQSPLLDVSINGARGVLFNVTGPRDLMLHELNQAAQVIADVVDADAEIIFGTVVDETMGDEVKITVIATGFPDQDEMADALADIRPLGSAAGAQRDGSLPSDQVQNPSPPLRTLRAEPPVPPSTPTPGTARPGLRPDSLPGGNDTDLPTFLRRSITSR